MTPPANRESATWRGRPARLFPFLASGFLLFLFLLLFFFATPQARAAAAISNSAQSFTAADGSRTYMDLGKVWNGSNSGSTNGDTITVTYTNTGDATAFDFRPSVTLPANVTTVGTPAVVITPTPSPAVTASFSGTAPNLTVNLTQSGGSYDLPVGAKVVLTYKILAGSTATPGTPAITHGSSYSATDNGSRITSPTTSSLNITLRAGDSTITVTPPQQEKAVGETATFNITVTNTGLGGLFDVTIDESAINGANGNLVLQTLTSSTPGVTGSSPVLTIPYLAPGATFTATATAKVNKCGDITNTVVSRHYATGTATTEATAAVQLNFQQPLVVYSPSAVTLSYNNAVAVSFPINNTGLGAAQSFKLNAAIPAGLTVGNVASGWTYSNGVFTYTANSGTIPNGGSATLSYTLSITNPCTTYGNGTITYSPSYTNACGDPYFIPIQTQNVLPPTDAPSLTLTKTVSSDRLAIGEQGSYTLTLSANNVSNISSPTNIVVTDVLPAAVEYLSHTFSSGTGITVNRSGQTVTWTVPRARFSTNGTSHTLTINFAVANDPCNAGTQPINTASTNNLTTNRSCTLNATASASFLISNNPGLVASQFFNVTGSPTGGLYETGNADSSTLGTLGTRDAGEGEFIPLEAGYTFGSTYPGTWTGSTYRDRFGEIPNTQMSLTRRSGSQSGVEYRWRTGAGSWSSWLWVPYASLSLSSPGFSINLGFLNSVTGGDAVANKSVEFRYYVTATDAAVSSAPYTLAVTQTTTLNLAGAGTGSPGGCNTPTQSTFTQGVFYTLARAQAQIALSLPATLEVCKDELLTLTVSNANAKQARDILVTLLNSGTDYVYDTGYTPTYGGVFSSGNITYTANGGVNPTFQYTGDALTGNGTITVRVRRKAYANGDTTPRSLTARVNYDSWDTVVDTPTTNRAYNSTTTYTPSAIRKATLALRVTPETLSVVGDTVTYVINATNTDAGAAYGSQVVTTLPTGITVDTGTTTGYVLTTDGSGRQVLTWNLGTIASGATLTRTIVAKVGTGTGCGANIGATTIQAFWGCDAIQQQTVIISSPAYVFPSGKMQILHDTSGSVAKLCDSGTIVVILRNTGPTQINNAVIKEVTSPSTTGITINGTVKYSVNGGTLLNAASAPTGTGASGSPYTWTSTQISALSKLQPGDTIRLEIPIQTNSSVFSTSATPGLNVSASGTRVCGDTIAFPADGSPGDTFSIPVQRPVIVVNKTGRNKTANQPNTNYTETVYGGRGDVIEWQVTVQNTGNIPAMYLRITDQLTGTGTGNTATISGPGITGTQTLNANTPFVISSATTLAAGATATYLITETIGNTCASGTLSPLVDVTWGCSAPAAGQRNTISAPGTPSDTASLVLQPTIGSGSATLSQSIEYLNGGRAKVTVTIENLGGNAYALVLEDHFRLSGGADNPDMVLDTTVAPTFTHTRMSGSPNNGSPTEPITGVTVNNTNTAKPTFTFTGGTSVGFNGFNHIVRYMDRVTLTYYVRPTVADTTFASSFPDLATTENGTARDPSLPRTATNRLTLTYRNACNTATSPVNDAELDLKSPNLDITAVGPNSGNTLLTATGTTNFTFTVTNVGDAASIADFINLKLTAGTGWSSVTVTLTTPGVGGTGGTATKSGNIYTFTPAQVGTLAKDASAVITVAANYNATSSSGPLSLLLEAKGEARSQNGTTVNHNYSLDQRAQRVLGVTLAKTRQSTSEPDGSSSANYALIGEDVTWRVTATIRGAEDAVTNIRIFDQLRRGARTANDDNNFGFVRVGSTPFVSTTGTGHTAGALTLASATNNAGTATNATSGLLTFSVPNLTAADTATGKTIAFDLVARAQNLAAGGNNNNDDATRYNRAGLRFDYLGVTFYPPSANNYGGLADIGTVPTAGNTGVAVADLYQQDTVIIRRPGDSDLTIAKTVRNLTKSETTFNATTAGQAGDVVEYKIVITSNAAAARPFHSLRVTDTVPAKIVLDTTAANRGRSTNGTTIATNGLGAIDVPTNTITFDPTNAVFGTIGANLARLDNGTGNQIIFLYRGTLQNTVNPNETLTNNASAIAYSVPVDASGKSTNQLAMQGTALAANSTPSAPRYYSATTSANVTINPITIVDTQKRIIATSVGSDTSTTVQIGEQIRYEIGLILPQGTIPSLRVYDQLPAGLGLLTLESVQFGSAIDSASRVQPTLVSGVPGTPQTPHTPASPLAGNPLSLTWKFADNVLVNTGADADRTVYIRYVAQVRNIAANTRTTTLTNNAQFSFANTGSPAKTSITSITATIAEPVLTITHGVRNQTRNPSGSYVTTINGNDATNAPDAGDILQYQTVLTNTTGGTYSPAYDLRIIATLPPGVSYVPDSTSLPALGNPEITGDISTGFVLTWGRDRTAGATDHDLAPGASLTFTYRTLVADTSRPGQPYASKLTADWTSLDGTPGPDLQAILPATPVVASSGAEYGERASPALPFPETATLPNNYHRLLNTTVTARDTSVIVKVRTGDDPLPRKADDTPGDPPRTGGFRIGDIVTYTVTATLQEGTLNNFRITDQLPAGLAFINTVSITPAPHGGTPTATQPLAYTVPVAGSTAPAANATGTLTWNFGNLVNTGVDDQPAANNNSNNTLAVTYRARVLNDATGTSPLPPPPDAASATVTRKNTAALGYKLANDADASRPVSEVTIEVKQPLLTLTRLSLEPDPALCSGNVLQLGETGKYRLTLTNTGSAPAYNLVFTETVPVFGLSGAPVLQSATLNGSNILPALATPAYDAVTGVWVFTLADNQPVLPGQSLVLEYTYQIGTSPTLRGQTLPFTGTINAYHSLPAGIDDPPGVSHRRPYAAVGPAPGDIIVGLEIKGFVYNDIEPNGHRDGFENWNAGPLVYVNLVNSDNQVCRSVQVAAGSVGNYLIPRVAPGAYKIIVTTSASSITATAPTAWLFRSPADGTRPVTLGIVDLQEENIGLYQGTGALTGIVFKDTGATGGAGANNGQQEPAEPGIPGVTVRLLSGGVELATTVTDGSGQFALYVPASVSAGATLIIEEVNPSGYISTGATLPGGVTGSYDRAADRITFTYNPVGSMSGFKLGDVPVNAFHTDGAQTILPGATAFYRHTFVAGTAGTITFTFSNSAAPSNVPWAQVLLRDADCNGTPGVVLGATTPVTVAAGDSVCILLKDTSSAGAPYGAVNTTTVTATFAYTGSAPALSNSVLTRQDVTTIGIAASAGLQLTKAVDKTTAGPGEQITYTITYTNVGADLLDNLYIYDATPAYTTFVSAGIHGPLPADLTSYTITGPGSPGSATNATLPGSGTGGIKWTFAGELTPGASGKVIFTVRVQD
ncbi:DUF11 domain-containing protein [Opitutaceae bacterium TAV4]|nr:DUF11 domain-containing protein [Opitutaceae bacterium TAV4]